MKGKITKQSRLSKFLLIVPALLVIIVDYFGWGLVYPLATAIIADPKSGLLPAGVALILRDFYLSLSFLLYPLYVLFGASSWVISLIFMVVKKYCLFVSLESV